jgi:membrane fusion protein (multidrug efflux system)
LEEGVNEKGVLAPQQGVSRDAKGNATALVVGKDGKVEERPLTLDRALADRWLVTAGLGDGDQVIVEGLQKIRPGVSVKAVAYAPRPAGASPAAGGAPAGGGPQAAAR